MTSCLRSLTKMQSPDAFSEVEQTSGYRQGNLSSLGSIGMERDSAQPWGLARGAFQDPRVTQGFAVLRVGGAARWASGGLGTPRRGQSVCMTTAHLQADGAAGSAGYGP